MLAYTTIGALLFMRALDIRNREVYIHDVAHKKQFVLASDISDKLTASLRALTASARSAPDLLAASGLTAAVAPVLLSTPKAVPRSAAVPARIVSSERLQDLQTGRVDSELAARSSGPGAVPFPAHSGRGGSSPVHQQVTTTLEAMERLVSELAAVRVDLDRAQQLATQNAEQRAAAIAERQAQEDVMGWAGGGGGGGAVFNVRQELHCVGVRCDRSDGTVVTRRYICHELRNPLHGIAGLVEACVVATERVPSNLPLVLETCGHMSRLLDDLRDLSMVRAARGSRRRSNWCAPKCSCNLLRVYTCRNLFGTLCAPGVPITTSLI